MHISFLQITTFIFPEESDHNISRKYLSVMGMSAEIHVHPRIRQFLKFSRLMIDNQHWQ